MIVEFSVENFMSFKDLQTLQMQAAKIKSKYPEVDANNTFDAGKNTLLKTKAIYGANASGKSNLVFAMIRMISLVNSLQNNSKLQFIKEAFVLNTRTIKEPTFFQLVFYVNSVLYRYGFTYFRGKIKSEWLFGTPNKKEVYFFTREGNNVEVNPNQFKEGEKMLNISDDDLPLFNENSFFLSVVATFKGRISKAIVDYFNSIKIVREINKKESNEKLIKILKVDDKKRQISNLLQKADFGIKKLDFLDINTAEILSPVNGEWIKVELDKKPEIPSVYKEVFDDDGKFINDAPMSFSHHESEGTRKLFYLSPDIFEVLENGSVMVMDEFDAHLHPQLTKAILQLFNSNETNPNNAQLIFTTHNSNLLDAKLLRRDQICIVEKNEFGASELTNLSEFKGIRNDSSFEKDYLKGKFGGVPVLNDFARAFKF